MQINFEEAPVLNTCRALLALATTLITLTLPAQLTRQTTISTQAGTGTAGYASAQDGGLASAAQLSAPQGIVIDVLGNVFLADTANNRVRRIDAKTGIISTIAGNGTAGYRVADENVVATFAQLNAPQDLALDNLGDLFIADTGNHRVRRVVLATGIINTFAGAGGTTYNQQEQGPPTSMNISQPTGVTVDPGGMLYIADAALNRIFQVPSSGSGSRISTYAGTGTAAYTTAAVEEGAYPNLANLSGPRSVTSDRNGDIYIADTGNNRIRRVNPKNNLRLQIVTVYGNGSAYSAASEGALAASTGIGGGASLRLDIAKNMYMTLTTGNRVLKITSSTGRVATLIGTGTASFSDNTLPTMAGLSAPVGLAVNGAGTVFIADTGNHRLRSVPVATGNLLFSKMATGSSDTTHALIFTADTALTLSNINVLTSTGASAEFVAGTPIGCAPGSAMNAGDVCAVPLTFTPAAPSRRSVAIQIGTSAGNKRFGLSGVGLGPLVVYSPQNASQLAGTTTGSYTPGEDGGPATAAHFATLDNLNVDPVGNLLVADARGARVRRVGIDGIVNTVAGGGTAAYSAADEGAIATSVSLSNPVAAVADAAGNLYINDSANGRIRKVDAVTGRITTIAGGGTTPPTAADGVPATSSPLSSSGSLFIDQQGNLFLADPSGQGSTRRIDAASGYIHLICGSCNGSVTVDENGTPYVVGTNFNRINTMTGTIAPLVNNVNGYGVTINSNGDVLYLTAQGLQLFAAATGTTSNAATFINFNPIALDAMGNGYGAQSFVAYQIGKSNSQIASLAYSGFTVVGQSSSDSPQKLALTNIGNAPLTFPAPTAGMNPSLTSDFQVANSSTCSQLATTSAPYSLPVAAACYFNINFIPVAPGSVQGQAVFTDNQFGSTTPVTQTSTLTGTASGTAVTTSFSLTGLVNATAGTAQSVTVTAFSGNDQTHTATNYVGTVTFTSNDSKTGVLPAAYTFTTADAGRHTFIVTLKTANDNAFVAASDNANSALTARQSARISSATPSSSGFTITSGTPQSTATNAQFASSLVVNVKDTYGNGVPGVQITYAFPLTGASASSTSNVTTTDSLGEARAQTTANGITGGYYVVVTAAGVAYQVYFQLTNTAPVYNFTLAASSTSLTYGPDVRLSATITPYSSNGHDPTGTVTFYEGSTVLSSGPVPAGHANPTYLVAAPSVGSHTYSASYTGDSVYPAFAKTSAVVAVTVTKGGSLIGVPFTPTVQRPGSFAISVGNDHGADSSTKAFTPPSGVVGYTISPACGNGGVLSGSLTLVNGATTFPVPADCPARSYGIAYTYAGDTNYNAATYQPSTSLTVTAAPATVTITNTDQNYDGTPKSVTVTTNPSGVAVSVSYGSGAPPTLAGSYPVHVTVTDPNYTGSGDATLLVRRGPVGIVWPLLDPIAYGMPLSTTQLSATTSVQGSFAFNPLAGTVLTPGNYTLSVTFTPNDSPTTPTTATQALTVINANLQVNAVDAGRMYAAANPAFTAMVTGAVNGDTFTTGGSTTANAGSPVGTYPITPTISGTNLAYYNVTQTNGTLTVSGTPATVTLGNLNQTYNGTARAATVTTTPAGLATTVTYSGSANAPSAPGSYSVVATITDPNYTGTANGVFSITNGSAPVSWNPPAAIAYGTPLTTTQLNATSIAQGTFVYTPALGTVLLPGTQTLTTVFTPSASGTTPTTATVTLLVNKGALTVTAASASRRFGTANLIFTTTFTGAVNNDVLSATATTTATSSSPLGTYAIVPTVSGANVSAYDVTTVNGTLTVTAGSGVVVVTADKPTTYVGDTVTFTASVTGSGVTPSGTVELFNGTTSLGVKTLQLNGTATYTVSTLAAGTYNFTANYSGDAVYGAAASPIMLETIFTSDYTIVVNPTVLTIHRGQTGIATFTVTPTGNFHDAITFTCGTLPARATCSFSPATLTPSGQPISTTLTIATTSQMASSDDRHRPWRDAGSGAVLAALVGLMFGLRKRRSFAGLLSLVLLGAALCASITGCASGPATTPNGNYSVSVSAGVSTGGSAAHAVNLTVNIID